METPVPLSEITLISTRLAQAYAGKSERTAVRDLEYLIGAGLVERTPEGYRAKREVILAFRAVSAGG